VAAVAGAVGHRHAVPWKAGAARQQRGLVGLDREQVVGLLSGHQELGGLGVGLQRPARRAAERDEQAIARWVAKDWP
jgi:Winged helix-turn helix